MKLNLYAFFLLILSCLSFQGIGQAISDRTETDCNGQSRSVYEEIGSNKVIFIVAAATNCGSCMSEAPDVASFAYDNAATITVWGAMNNLFGSTDCSSVDLWESQYSWDGIFTFLDNDDYWVNGGFSYFTVINPDDSSIAYTGLSFQSAKDTAEALSQLVGIDEPINILDVQDAYPNPFSNDITVKFNVNSSQLMKIRLFDITGQQIYTRDYQAKPYMKEIKLDLIDISIQEGVYLLRVENGDNVRTIRMVKD